MIGLTGAYCAGKNYIGRLLSERGYEVLDIDKLGHRVLDERKDEIVCRWPGCVRADGSLDRRALGALVFGRPSELTALENIVHPAVEEHCEAWLRDRDEDRVVLNAALLHRSKLFNRLDFIILVEAPILIRFFRALKRDKLPIAALTERFSSQADFSSQYFKNGADIVIVRNRSDWCPFRGLAKKRLERRLDSILARKGMVRQLWNNRRNSS